MEIKEILEHDNEFKYMLLSRLQQDCYGFISYGDKLWAKDPKEHMATMVAIYKDLKKKPEWLTLKELKELHFKLTHEELKMIQTVRVHFEDGSHLETRINGNMEDVLDYYKIGRAFNLGGEEDDLQKVSKVESIKEEVRG